MRFEPLLPELLTVHNPSDSKLTGLFSISSLEAVMRRLSNKNNNRPGSDVLDPRDADADLYAAMFRRIVTSNRVVLFDTLNHPVSQVFVVEHARDLLDDLRRMVVEFRNYAYPKYFQMSDVLVHVFIVYDARTTNENDVVRFQNEIRTHLTLNSTAVPVDVAGEKIRMAQFDNATIDSEVQHISLQQTKERRESGGGKSDGEERVTETNQENTEQKSEGQPTALERDSQSKNSLTQHDSGLSEENTDVDSGDYIDIPASLDSILRSRMHEYVSRHLIPHMEQKIRTWDDGILAPKKSITGRFFSVSRKLFNSEQVQMGDAYNAAHNYYYRASPEQALRKLADWAVMLKDFKYAYSTYDLIKKDYTNDKAWVYVAAAQEMCMAALLLAQTQPLASDTLPQPPDKNTLRKIRHDIIEPYVDNLSYTFKSRFNVRTYAVRAYLVVAELLLNMSVMFHIPWWWSDLVTSYYDKCIGEINAHMAAQEGPQALRAVLYERLGYATGRLCYVPHAYRSLIPSAFPVTREIKRETRVGKDDDKKSNNEENEEAEFQNPSKLPVDSDTAIKGLTRFRKRLLWYLMAIREWMRLDNVGQVRVLASNVEVSFQGPGWYDREGLLWAKVKDAVESGVV